MAKELSLLIMRILEEVPLIKMDLTNDILSISEHLDCAKPRVLVIHAYHLGIHLGLQCRLIILLLDFIVFSLFILIHQLRQVIPQLEALH